MILPFLNHKKQLSSPATSYELFQKVNALELNDTFFESNLNNLVSSIEQVEPLIMKFRNQRAMFQRVPTKYFSTTVWATIKENGTTNIDILVKTDPFFYMIYAMLTLGLLINVLQYTISNNALPFIISIAIFAVADVIAKRSILKRVEEVLMAD